MNELIMRNIRCFVAPEHAVIKPLTLVLGDNSAGKTTLLSCIRLAWDMAYRTQKLDFNEDPFRFGAFEQIAHMFGGKKGRARTITLGFREMINAEQSPSGKPECVHRELELGKRGAESIVVSNKIDVDGIFTLHLGKSDSGKWTVSYKTPEKTVVRDIPAEYHAFLTDHGGASWDMLLHISGLAPYSVRPDAENKSDRLSEDEYLKIHRLLGPRFQNSAQRPFAVAPIRTQPERTYNPAKETPGPEGSHVPLVLAKTFFGDKSVWTRLKAALEDFGKAGGLFDYIDVRPLGKSESDPFQIRVRLGGPKINYVDVGYGVSQVLPILVDAILSEERARFLWQQPEVHLHPRGQAALGTFLARMSSGGRHFVVETHSDYLVNRVRSEVAAGSIPAENVSILFLERKRNQVQIHNMSIDSLGNLKGAPKGYRKFFFDEDRRFLGT
ncbi:MAG: AAA family ATPase [Pseudomonadota bacterium]